MWPAIAAGGAAIAGGLIGASGAKKAAQAQAAAAEAATAEQRRQFNLSRRDMMPWQRAGTGAVNELSQLMGINTSPVRSLDSIINQLRKSGKYTIRGPVAGMPQENADGQVIGTQQALGPVRYNEKALMAEAQRLRAADLARREQFAADPNFGALTREFTLQDFENDPVIQKSLQFGLDEGTKALSRMARSRGMYNSGQTLKGLTRFAEDYVGQQAGQSRDRFVQDQQNLYNRYAGLSGTGQTAAQNTANLGANYATNVGNNIVGAGNARGAASIAGANAIGGALSNTANAFQRQYFMDQIMNPSASPVQPMVAGQFNLDSYG